MAARVPADFPVREICRSSNAERDAAISLVTCGTCGRSWDDAVITAYTPTPSARCPFEAYHPS